MRPHGGFRLTEREECKMPIENVKTYLAARGLADRVIEFDQSSATVAEAAADLGC